VGIRTTEDAASFSLTWVQQAASYDIRLTGTLGVPVAHLYADENGVTIELPSKGKYEAFSASDLLFEHTGLVLPVESLRFWVRGNPDPDLTFERDQSTLIQSGWKIEYLEYEGPDPVRIRLTKPEVRIMLVVKAWIY